MTITSGAMRLIHTLILLVAVTLAAGGKDYTIVIDPGHGGRDAGALGRRTNEKTVNLEVGKRLRDLINSNMTGTKVVMTRDNDVFVPLQTRADIANRQHADIFISIHANSVDKKSPLFTSVNGASVYTLGLRRSDTNLSVAMRENAVMKLEPDYTTTYEGFDPTSAESYIVFEMMQHSNQDQSIELAEAVQNQLVRTAGRKNNGVRQDAFWVLVRTGMPAILVELDFICNPTMERFMASADGQQKLALAIYRGIEKFRRGNGKKNNAAAPSKPATVIAADSRPDELPKIDAAAESVEAQANATVETAAESPVRFRIQFLTASSVLKAGDKRLKGLKSVDHYTEGSAVKYTTGDFATQAEASRELKNIKKLFPDAFVIRTQDGKRIK